MQIKEDKYFIFDRAKDVNLKYILKIFLSRILGFYYKILMYFLRPQNNRKNKYNVSICAIFKNESKYIKEWIEFHKIVGIEHFYMYNNFSEDDYKSVLNSYINEGIVTLIEWPKKQGQIEAYHDCIKRFSLETKWLGFIDLDEFIVPNKTETVYDFLKQFDKKRPSVLIYWKMFCSSGLIKRNENKLLIENFNICWPKYDTVGKCFYNTSYIFPFDCKYNKILHHIHWGSIYKIILPPVNMFDEIVLYDIHKAKSIEPPIQINHYFTKSLKEYYEKKSKGDVYFKNNPHDMIYFYKHEKYCTSVDYHIYKYLIKLKLNMNKLE